MKTISIFSLLFIFSAILSAQVPEWYVSHQHPKYPVSEYIIGVGSGPSGTTGAEAAKKSALSDIATQLRVQVQSEMKSVTQNFSVNDDEQVYSDFKRQSRTMVNDEITGADVIETVTDDQTMTVYALLVLNRDKYSMGLRAELESGWKQASDLRAAAKDFAAKGRLNESIQSINQIKQVIAPLLAKQVMHNAAARAPFAFPSVFNPAALQNDIRGMLAQVKLEKRGGDNQQGKIGEKFAQPFAAAVTLNGVPCSGISVQFMLDEKTKLGEETTDDKGMAAFTTIVRNGSGITARISLTGLGREFEQNLASSAVTFTWSAQASDKAFSVTVNSKNKKLAKMVSDKLSAAISQIGYKVVTMSKNGIIVELSSGVPSTIEGMGGTLYNLTLEATVSLKDNSANAVIGTASFTAKGVGSSEDEAIMKAATGLKFDQKELSELLQK